MRAVLFVDPPAFCTSVEGLVAPALRSRPVAVAPPGADRAVILALSLEARAAGLARGMAVRVARRLCPDLILLPPNLRLYARASRALHEVLARWAPIIEPRGYGHAFLDLSGTDRLWGPAQDVALRIGREARSRLGLVLSVGVASNKLVSEAATRSYRQHSPMPTDFPPLQIHRGDEADFLAPHPLVVLPGIPDPIRRQLDDYQLERIGEVAQLEETDLVSVFGQPGRTLRARARGIDPRPVLPPHVRHQFELDHTLATDTNNLLVLQPLLRRMTDRLGHRLRQRCLSARRLSVRLDFADYAAASRSLSLPCAALDDDLWSAARRALAATLTRRTAVRTLTVRVDRLVASNTQLELWDTPAASRSSQTLQVALDRIITRWGAGAAQRGTAVRSVRS